MRADSLTVAKRDAGGWLTLRCGKKFGQRSKGKAALTSHAGGGADERTALRGTGTRQVATRAYVSFCMHQRALQCTRCLAACAMGMAPAPKLWAPGVRGWTLSLAAGTEAVGSTRAHKRCMHSKDGGASPAAGRGRAGRAGQRRRQRRGSCLRSSDSIRAVKAVA